MRAYKLLKSRMHLKVEFLSDSIRAIFRVRKYSLKITQIFNTSHIHFLKKENKVLFNLSGTLNAAKHISYIFIMK